MQSGGYSIYIVQKIGVFLCFPSLFHDTEWVSWYRHHIRSESIARTICWWFTIFFWPDGLRMRHWPRTNCFEHCTISESPKSAIESVLNRRSVLSTGRGFKLSALYALIPLVIVKVTIMSCTCSHSRQLGRIGKEVEERIEDRRSDHRTGDNNGTGKTIEGY